VAAGYFGTNQGDAARAIGEAYLKEMRIETTPAAILAAVAGTLALIDGARTQTAIIAALVAAVRLDFQEGRLVELYGWVLSRTEVELCALTLLPPG
jgi:cytochrome c-type biogenesis protein CcmH/NrfG